jgi:hypothetical protein
MCTSGLLTGPRSAGPCLAVNHDELVLQRCRLSVTHTQMGPLPCHPEVKAAFGLPDSMRAVPEVGEGGNSAAHCSIVTAAQCVVRYSDKPSTARRLMCDYAC